MPNTRLEIDNLCKRLAEGNPSAYVNLILGHEAENVCALDTELRRDAQHMDFFASLESENHLFHIEFQRRLNIPLPMALRMADYAMGIYRKYPEHGLTQVLILLDRRQGTETGIFQRGNTTHQFQVLRVWEEPVERFLASPATLPLAILAGEAATIEEAMEPLWKPISSLPTEVRREVLASAATLAGISFDKELIARIFKNMESIIWESSTMDYLKDIFEANGFLKAERQALLDVLEVRFADVPYLLRERIQYFNDPAMLRQLYKQAVVIESLEAFTGLLDQIPVQS